MRYYKLLALAAIFLCGSSFASDVYFVCDTAKGTIKLDENNGVILRAPRCSAARRVVIRRLITSWTIYRRILLLSPHMHSTHNEYYVKLTIMIHSWATLIMQSYPFLIPGHPG